jgi:hypothetical protein
MLEPERELGPVDAHLFGHLAPRALIVGFTGGAHAAREDVVAAGIDVLGERAPVHQHVTGGLSRSTYVQR